MNSLEARDAMLGVIKDAWNPSYPLLWPDVPSKVPSQEVPWARVSLFHTDSNQSSINGQVGCRRYDSRGVLTVQVFAPIGDGYTRLYELAEVVRHAYQDARLPVWFRNVRINEIGPSGSFNQINVLADFEYDTVR